MAKVLRDPIVPESTSIRSVAAWWAIAVALQVVTMKLAFQKEPNPVAAGLLQCATLVFSGYGSVVLGKRYATADARELIRPHARSAIRRVVNLYEGTLRQREQVLASYEQLEATAFNCETAERVVRLSDVQFALQPMRSMVTMQLITTNDAFEDWRDLAPEEVEAILSELEGTANERSH